MHQISVPDFCKTREVLTIFVSHISLKFSFFYLLLSSKAAPQLVLPLLCCHPLTFLLWRSLSTKHLSCFYALSLLSLHSFSSQGFFSSPSYPYYWIYSCLRSLPTCSHTAAIPLPNFHCLWGHGTCHTTCQVWHLDFLSLLLGWKADSGEITVSMHFPLHIHSSKQQQWVAKS